MRLTIASFALLLAVGLVSADDKRPATRVADGPVKATDFLPQALDEAMALERFSTLADKRAGSDKVKEAARKLQADAKAYREELTDAAKGLKVGFLTGLQAGNQATYVRLATLNGEKFDDEYLKAAADSLTRLKGLVVGQEKSDVASVSKFVKDRQKAISDHADAVRGMRKDK